MRNTPSGSKRNGRSSSSGSRGSTLTVKQLAAKLAKMLETDPGMWAKRQVGYTSRDMAEAKICTTFSDNWVCGCLVGIVCRWTQTNMVLRVMLFDKIDAIIRREPGGATSAGWNDRPERTVNDIIRVFKRVAK